jgi:hypothetical protein
VLPENGHHIDDLSIIATPQPDRPARSNEKGPMPVCNRVIGTRLVDLW